MSLALSDLTFAALLARAEWAVLDRRQAVVEEFDIALAWVDAHGEPPAVEVPGGEQLIRLGGEGTPLVLDLCLAEFAIARHEHLHTTRTLVADLLDLRHRLPRLWAQVQTVTIEPWLARKVASMSRRLTREAARLVDAAAAEALGQSPGRLLRIVEAKVIEADTAARAEELEQARSAKGVWLTSTREDDVPGLRSIYARLEAGDAVWVDATIQRVADLLATDPDLRTTHHPELGDKPSPDELRAAAFAWLARPHDLATLLGLLDNEDESDQGDTRRRQRAVLYVHLHQAALDGIPAVARTSLGPLLLDQVTGLLGHAHVTLTPVIDLNTGHNVNGYEHPAAVKERALLRTAGSVFPHATSLHTSPRSRLDHDHPVPYDPLGPPGQTGDHNDAPLDRRSHRAKTHHDYRVEQLAHGTYLWTTPHGLTRLVNHTGTHRLTEDDLPVIRRIHAA